MNYEKNIKLFPIYKMFSYDILFYYGISILYLTLTKGFSTSQVVLLGALYSIFAMLLQIPAVVISDKLGLKKSLVLGNLFEVFWGINMLMSHFFGFFIIGELFLAMGYALKNVSEFPYVFKIMKKANQEEEITRVEGKGSALYFVFEAFACVVSGFLFKANPYLPIIFATLCALSATIISSRFISIPPPVIGDGKKDYFEDLKHGFKFIFQSSRLKSLLLFACIFFGIVSVAGQFSKVYLTDLKLSSVYFGFVFAAISIIAAVGSRLQRRLEKITKNKTLTYISIIFISIFLILGISYLLGFSRNILIILGVSLFGIQAFLKGGYRIIIKNYLNNFTSSAIRSKILSIYYLIESLGSGIFLLIASEMLNITSVGLSLVIFGIAFMIIMLICLQYMKPKCGLKMEEYDKTEIQYSPEG